MSSPCICCTHAWLFGYVYTNRQLRGSQAGGELRSETSSAGCNGGNACRSNNATSPEARCHQSSQSQCTEMSAACAELGALSLLARQWIEHSPGYLHHLTGSVNLSPRNQSRARTTSSVEHAYLSLCAFCGTAAVYQTRDLVTRTQKKRESGGKRKKKGTKEEKRRKWCCIDRG